LAKERLDDVLAACQKLAELPREEGQPAFPAIETVLSMVGLMAVARRHRESPPKFLVCLQCSVNGSHKSSGHFSRVASLPTHCDVISGGVKCGGFMAVMVDERGR
jgi:hypothetical protein